MLNNCHQLLGMLMDTEARFRGYVFQILQRAQQRIADIDLTQNFVFAT